MAKTYSQLMKQIDDLQREAADLKRKEVDGVIKRIREAIEVYGLTAADLGLAAAKGPDAQRGVAKRVVKARGGRKSKTVAVKYRDEAGNTWGGRGPRPAWLRTALAAGKQLTDFAV